MADDASSSLDTMPSGVAGEAPQRLVPSPPAGHGPSSGAPSPKTLATAPTAEEEEDEAEVASYEAEARLLALHRQQQEALLRDGVGPVAVAGGDDDDMYEEDEEQEEIDDAMITRQRQRQQQQQQNQGASSSGALGRRQTTGPSGVAPKPAASKRVARSGSAKPRVSAAARAGGVSPRKRGTGEEGATKPRRKKKERKKVLNCSLSKYALIRELASEFGFVIEDDDEVEKFGFNMIWADTVLPLQKLTRLANWQRFNHFPSMHLLCRKGHLGLTLGRMRRAFPDEYGFYPRTWALRSERNQFAKHMQQQGGVRKTYIMKPNAGCQGRGIVLTRDPLNAVEDGENYVVQEYMSRPLLIEGKKFDLRVYVLVTSVRHLSIMVFHDGLVRICADNYAKPTDANLASATMHLTNYAVNKHSENFVFNTDEANSTVGNKRDFKFLNDWLRSEGHDVDVFWSRIDDAIVKAVIAALPKLQHVYSSVFPHSNDGYTCFEVLGFDILVDEKLRPWLLEVNHTPSFHTDTPLDHRIKHSLLHEVWSIVRVSPNDKARHNAREKAIRARRLRQGTSLEPTEGEQALQDDLMAIDPQAVVKLEDSRRKGFRRAFPHPNPMVHEKYELLIRGSREANEDKTTAAQEARNSEAKAERDKREAQRELERQLMPAAVAAARGLQAPAGGNGPASPVSASAAASPVTLDGGTAAATAKQWVQQLRSSAPPLENTASIVGDANGTARGRCAGLPSTRKRGGGSDSPSADGMPTQSAPPKARDGGSARTGSGGPSTPPAAPPAQQRSGQQRPRPVPPSEASSSSSQPKLDAKAMRERLHEQMEKHRRRMVLGPRLSVFQLRDTQLEALLKEQQQDQQQHNAYGHLPQALPPGYALGAAQQAAQQQQQQPQPQAQPQQAPPSQPRPRERPPADASGSANPNGGTAAPPTVVPLVPRDKAVPPLQPPPGAGSSSERLTQHRGSGSRAPPDDNTGALCSGLAAGPAGLVARGAAANRGAGGALLSAARGSLSNAPPPLAVSNPAAPPVAPNGSGGGGGSGAHAVAVSAATLQSHWLYHYDA